MESTQNIQKPLETLSELIQVLDEEERATVQKTLKKEKAQIIQFVQHPT